MPKLLSASLIISLLGTLILLSIMFLIPPKTISNCDELKLNELVQTQGKITSIKSIESFLVIRLDNNLTLTCDNCRLKQNQSIIAEGKVSDYRGELQITADRIQ